MMPEQVVNDVESQDDEVPDSQSPHSLRPSGFFEPFYGRGPVQIELERTIIGPVDPESLRATAYGLWFSWQEGIPVFMPWTSVECVGKYFPPPEDKDSLAREINARRAVLNSMTPYQLIELAQGLDFDPKDIKAASVEQLVENLLEVEFAAGEVAAVEDDEDDEDEQYYSFYDYDAMSVAELKCLADLVKVVYRKNESKDSLILKLLRHEEP